MPEREKLILLLEGCLKNNRSSQKELYYLLLEFAMSVCYRYTNSGMEAEELTNEGFVKLFKNIHRFDIQRQSDVFYALKGWFKRILINTCIDEYRKKQHQILTHTHSEDIDRPSAQEATALDGISYKEIIEAVRQLTPGYRNVFNLFVIEGLSHEEIAELLDISVGTSKSNLSKARERMKKILQDLTRVKVYA